MFKIIKKIIVFIFSFLLVFSLNVYADTIYVEGSHSPGVIDLNIMNGTPPYKIYKSVDEQNYQFIMEITSNKYKESGLENGRTYWYKVVDSTGKTGLAKQTIPFTMIEVYPLEVTELGDNYVQLKWNSLYSNIDLYVNGSLWESSIKESSLTVDNLTSGKEYVFHFINRAGERSNSVRVTTSKNLDNLINRLDTLLTKLFVSDSFKVDSNNNGIVDGMEGIHNKGQEIINTPIIKYPSDIGDIIGNSKDKITTPSIDESSSALNNLPKFEIEFIPGHKVNILNLEPFIKEIKLIRYILVCMLYVGLFIYFANKLIPKLNA